MGSGISSIIILVVGVLGLGALVLGIWLLFRWKRATRVGLHPTCRGCGFDLSGLQLVMQGAPVPCPECGIALVEKNVAVGDPKRSVFMLVTGVCCVVAALGIFTLGARRAWPTLTTSLPTAVLVVQSGIDRADGVGTVSELASRVGTGRMTAAQTTTLVDRALDQQKNALVWTPAWGLIVENAHEAGLTSDAQWRQYIEVAAQPFVEASSKVAVGDPLSIDVGVRNCRVSARNSNAARVMMSVSAQIDGIELVQKVQGGGNFGLSPNGAAWSTFTGTTDKIEPGERTLTVVVNASIRRPEDDFAKPPLFTTKYEFAQPISVWQQGTATHRMSTDPAVSEEMRRAIDVSSLGLEDGFSPGSVQANFMVNISGIPRGIGMQMFLRVPTGEGKSLERYIGKVAIEAQKPQGSHGFGAGADVQDPKPLLDALHANGGVADLVFRPSIEAARSRPNLYEIWGEEIVIPSTKVKITLRDRAEGNESDGKK